MSRYSWRTLVLEIALWLIAIAVFAVPAAVLVNTAFKPVTELSSGLTPPTSPTLANFETAWIDGDFPRAFLSSAVVTIVSVTLIVVLSALAAYPLARSSRRWSKTVFVAFMAGLIVPQVGVIPLYITMRDLGLVGTLPALIIIYVGAGMPFNIFLYTIFIRSMPREYEEAAVLDGCGPFRTFWSVVFPLLRPVTGTIVILAVITVYNDFYIPLLYLAGTESSTLPLALRSYSSQYASNWNATFAGLIFVTIPVLAFYLVLQKRIIRGFAGGLKG